MNVLYILVWESPTEGKRPSPLRVGPNPSGCSLPRRPLDLAFLFRLLPERAVVVAAQVDAPRLADQFQLRQHFLDFLRREGPLRFLAAIDDAANFVGGHGAVDAAPP